MRLKEKLAYMAVGGILVFVLQLSANSIVSDAGAQGGNALQGGGVKYLFTIDYPTGQKADYLAWVKSNAEALQAPAELKGLTSYENYFGVSPNRFVEFEFGSMADAAKYFERDDLRPILDDVVNRAVNSDVHVLKVRGDYAK